MFARFRKMAAVAALAFLRVVSLVQPIADVAPSVRVVAPLAIVTALALAPQQAEAAALSNYLQNKLIDQLFRNQAYTFPTTLYVALATTASTAASCGTEVSGGSYARVAVSSSLVNWAGTQGTGSTTASTGTSGQTSNNAAITYAAPTANWGTVVSFCVFDASSGGNLLFYAPLSANQTISNGAAAPSFAAAALTYTQQ